MSAPDDALQTELSTYLHTQERRLHQFPRAVLVGLLAGVVGVAFRVGLQLAERGRHAALDLAHRHAGWGLPAWILVATAGITAAVLLVRRIAPEAAGSGVPHIKAVLYQLQSMRWLRVLTVKFFGGILGIGSGLALGREGPTIQMGGALGQMVARFLRCNATERQTLIAAGAGAGLAAAFNAPLAGMVFVLEEVQRDFTPTVFVASLIASVTADIVTRFLTSQQPIFHVASFGAPPLASIPWFAALGCLLGALGVIFNRGLLASMSLFERIRIAPLGAAMVGVVIAIVAWFVPAAIGGGYPLIDQVFHGALAPGAAALLFALCLGLTLISYGCGAPGGIFAPLLILGALAGSLVGQGARHLAPGLSLGPEVFAVVGMGAYFSAIVRAPLTGIVLLVEMTESYNLMLPLLVACMCAYGVAEALKDRPIYEAILERDLLRTQGSADLTGTFVLELTIQPGARFAGKHVRALDLPDGCLVISVRRGLRERVPTKETILLPRDHLTMVIGEEARTAVAALRQGAESPRDAHPAPRPGGS